MAKINIKEIDLSTYKVIVTDAHVTTHDVTVQIGYALSLTASKISTEQLIKNAFTFLLAREPNTSILRSFELSQIGFYFPEFEEKMRNQLT
jgi:hypothetical protein